MQGREVVKEITATGWMVVPEAVAPLLRLSSDDRVWSRARRALVDGQPAELSISYFPAEIAQNTDLMSPGPFPPGGVVGALERGGHRIMRTYNEVRSQLANSEELAAFGPDPELLPLHSRVMITVTRATYGANDEALEAVISSRPAAGAVVVFQTYEGPSDGEPHEPSITEKGP
jgi:DNA-binding GntR family transcriptional regulator